jgi:gliding motility-associated-like protein
MYKSVVVFICCLFLLTAKTSTGQVCEWISASYNANLEEIRTVTTDKNNDIIAGGNYYYKLSIDTFQRGTSNYGAGLIIKYTPDGTIKWVYNTTTTFRPLSVQAGAAVWQLKTDAQNNIYALCNMAGLGTVNFGNGYSITTTVYTDSMVLIKLNPDGIIQWMKTVAFTSNATENYRKYALTIDSKDNAIVGYNSFDYTPPVDSYSEGFHLAKYSPQGNRILSKSFLYKNALLFELDVDKEDNVYILGHADSSYVFGGNTLSTSAGVLVLKTDSLFNPVKGFQHNLNNNPYQLFHSYNQDPVTHFAVTTDGAVALTGAFKGTADFGGKIVTATNTSNLFLAYYDSDFSLKWVRVDSAQNATTAINDLQLRNNHIYGGGIISPGLPQPMVKFGGHKVNVVPYYVNLLIFKADTLGNVLWFFNSANPNKSYACDAHAYSIAVDSLDDCILGGAFATNPGTNSAQHYVTVFNRIAKGAANNKLADLFVAKIAPNGIFRGYVNPNPYCAGDTILIPYTKIGNYEPGNQFIAQLSDSAGNFDGGERELGRTTDTADGEIKGTLPMFNVATGKNYRIRILSTQPQVQSFYKKDSLRLLIYSRDTANAGPDLLVCKGQQVQLSVTGGTRWSWNPSTFVNNLTDTAKQQIAITADTTIDYRVIISDSSGCGLTDTDFVKVSVRPPLSATISGPASLCRGSSTLLSAGLTGGHSFGYHYTWQQETDLGFITLRTGKQPDIQVSPFATTRYRVIAGDSCTLLSDTAYFILNIDTTITVTPPADTTICKGHKAILTANGTGCNPLRHSYLWLIKNTPVVVATTQTAQLLPVSTTTYTIVLRDTIGKLYDTAEVTVFVDEVFTLIPPSDTTICVGQTIQCAATVLSCDTVAIKYVWTLNNNATVIGNGSALTISPLSTEIYRVIAKSDNNGLSDTAFVTVNVKPPLTVKISGPDTVCEGNPLTLMANIAGGNSTTYSLTWTEEGSLWTSVQNPTIHTPQANTKYFASVSDNCSPDVKDSLLVVVIPLPKAAFDVAPVEGCTPLQVVLTDKSVGNDTSLNIWKKSKTTTATGIASHTLSYYKNSNETFSLVVSNAWGCKDSISEFESIKVHKLPRADFIVKPDIRETGKELLLVNNSSGGILYQWQTGDGALFYHRRQKDTTYTYADSGFYTLLLKVTDENGCTDTATRVIRVFDAMFCVIPNAFTPNGDGNNEVFAPVCNGLSNYTLTIYSRWGQVLQECNNCHWDANYADAPVPDGLYLYKIQVNAESGLKEIIYGQLNVLR